MPEDCGFYLAGTSETLYNDPRNVEI